MVRFLTLDQMMRAVPVTTRASFTRQKPETPQEIVERDRRLEDRTPLEKGSANVGQQDSAGAEG